MFNTVLIGESGLGKSTAIGLGKLLLQSLPINRRPQILGATTPERLHKDLSINPHAWLLAPELAAFFGRQKYMEGMIPYVTHLLDYEEQVERRTLAGDVVTIREPACSIMGGSTVDWLQGALPDTAVSGGFLARFLVSKAEHKYRKIALPEDAGTPAEQADCERQKGLLGPVFTEAVLAYAGPIGMSNQEARNEYAYWYTEYQPASGFLAPFAARAGEFVLRLAMLSAIARQVPGIGVEDVQAGVALYEVAQRGLQDVVVPLTPQGKLVAGVLRAVGQTVRDESDIKHSLRNMANATEVARTLQSLLESRDLERAPGGYRRVAKRKDVTYE